MADKATEWRVLNVIYTEFHVFHFEFYSIHGGEVETLVSQDILHF